MSWLSGFGSAASLSFGGEMQWIKRILGRKTRPKINGEASRSHGERAIIVRWGETATVRRTPLRGREIKENDE